LGDEALPETCGAGGVHFSGENTHVATGFSNSLWFREWMRRRGRSRTQRDHATALHVAQRPLGPPEMGGEFECGIRLKVQGEAFVCSWFSEGRRRRESRSWSGLLLESIQPADGDRLPQQWLFVLSRYISANCDLESPGRKGRLVLVSFLLRCSLNPPTWSLDESPLFLSGNDRLGSMPTTGERLIHTYFSCILTPTISRMVTREKPGKARAIGGA